MIYNLEERVENFGKNIIILLQKIKQTSIIKPLNELIELGKIFSAIAKSKDTI